MVDREFDEDDRATLAAELALGVLEGDERAAALRLQLRDPGFARMVADWQRHTDTWLEEVEPHDVDPKVLERIESTLFSVGAADLVTEKGLSLVSVGAWRMWALTATASSLILTLGLLLLMREPTGQQVAIVEPPAQGRSLANIAQIDDPDGVPLLSAMYTPDSGSMVLRVADLQDQAVGPELWVIPPDGVPRSLGMLASSSVTIYLSPELRALLVDGATLAITLEPRDGVTHNAPSGSVLGTATLQSIPSGAGI